MAISSSNFNQFVRDGVVQVAMLRERMQNVFALTDKDNFGFRDTYNSYTANGEFQAEHVRQLVEAGVTFYEHDKTKGAVRPPDLDLFIERVKLRAQDENSRRNVLVTSLSNGAIDNLLDEALLPVTEMLAEPTEFKEPPPIVHSQEPLTKKAVKAKVEPVLEPEVKPEVKPVLEPVLEAKSDTDLNELFGE